MDTRSRPRVDAARPISRVPRNSNLAAPHFGTEKIRDTPPYLDHPTQHLSANMASSTPLDLYRPPLQTETNLMHGSQITFPDVGQAWIVMILTVVNRTRDAAYIKQFSQFILAFANPDGTAFDLVQRRLGERLGKHSPHANRNF